MGIGHADGHGPSAQSTVYAGLKVGPPCPWPAGMTLSDLREAQREFTNYARMRLTLSAEYDDGDSQRFESYGPERILLELRQEIADAVNYLTFLDIQLARWGKRIGAVS